MAERKPFLLRVDPALLEAVQRWANDDLRSLNAQIEFLLRRALQQAGRLKDDEKKAAASRESYRSTRSAERSPFAGVVRTWRSTGLPLSDVEYRQVNDVHTVRQTGSPSEVAFRFLFAYTSPLKSEVTDPWPKSTTCLP